jgi:predicted RNA-binding protein (virulence factor B family)
VDETVKVGSSLPVFLYKDSSDRIIATRREPKLTIGQLAVLKVRDVTKIGAFLDWGLEKDLFLPFKEQVGKPASGMKLLVALYVDKSGRLCGTMKVEKHLRTDSSYQKDARVWGTIYSINPRIGAFVAVDNRYFGLVQAKDLGFGYRIGDRIEARVTQVREDGKLNLNLNRKAYKQMEEDAEDLLQLFDSYEGVLPFTDKADPELIKAETGMTKNAFKRAVGRLLKAGKVIIEDDCIRRK